MKALIVFAMGVVAVAAQSPTARIINASRPGSADFQVGDRFEVVLTGAPNLPVSVRTMRQGKTDWGPVIARTDSSGRWSTAGQFEKQDFGGWREIWTVGGKVANPVVDFSVNGPCLPGGRAMISQSGLNEMLSCDTATGTQSFVTPSDGDSFRTPDGRLIPGRVRSNMTAEEYHMEIMQSMIGTRGDAEPGKLATEAGDLIMKMIGVNALTEVETKKVLSIIRAAYQPTAFRATEAEKPAMLALLEDLANQAEQESLKSEILETTNFVRTQ
jgi:hypothetical protein